MNPYSELATFAERFSDQSSDGWGLGYYDGDGKPLIHKKAGSARDSEEYFTAASAAVSRVVMAHLRNAGDKNTVSDVNAHPFLLSFLGRSWIFAHNGGMSIKYATTGERLDATIDSARIFEFLRDQISTWLLRKTTRSIFGAVSTATKGLYREFGGTANFVLTDGELCFVNKDGQHQDQIFVRRLRGEDDCVEFCTKELHQNEWVPVWKRGSAFRARLMLASAGSLLWSQRINA